MNTTTYKFKAGDKIRLLSYGSDKSSDFCGSVALITKMDYNDKPYGKIISGIHNGTVGNISGWIYELVQDDWDE